MRETLASANRLDRQQRHEAFWQGRKRKFFLIIGVLSLLLQVLFLGNMAYLYGSIWKSTSRAHNFNVLYVDYDAGIVGQSVTKAYQHLQGDGFPSLIQCNKDDYSSIEEVVNAVKDTTYWAAFVTKPSASNRIVDALQGGKVAQEYDPTGALTYVWNEVRYPPFSDEIFLENFENLIIATRLAYNILNGTAALSILNKQDPAALQVFLNPIMASGINIMPTTQQTKLFYNTVSMVMPILQQFFFLLILNGVSKELQIYSKLPLRISGLVRASLGIVFDLVASLCMSGYIWAFRETWAVTGKQFVLTWMVLWLLMHIHFLVIDACTAILPLPALPFFLLTWIIINITSSISPFEANPGFYSWGYALPTNEAYTVLTDIWSSGNVPQLYRAMPVLSSWWILGVTMATSGHFYRCHKAWKDEAQLNDLIQTTSNKAEQGVTNADALDLLRPTPRETLLAAAEMYRSTYGPSVPPPQSWRAFNTSDSGAQPSQVEHSEPEAQTAPDPHLLPEDPAINTDGSIEGPGINKVQ